MFEEPKVKNYKEQKYIRLRKLKASFISMLFYLFRIFPINRNLIAVCTFEGKTGFGCNPKYIVIELHRIHPEYKIVWLVNKNVIKDKCFPEYIKKVPNTVLSRAFWLTRAKIWIDNYRKPYGTKKRAGQYYLNTWHAGIGFKSIGLWRGDAFSKMAFLVSLNDSKMIDDIVIDSKYCEGMFRKGLLYEGSYIKAGQPRCDVLFGERIDHRKRFRQKYNLDNDCKIVMFAPTFREAANNGKRTVFSEIWSLDFSRMLETLEQKFGGDWFLCIRVHPQLSSCFTNLDNEKFDKRIINVSLNDDMYEILAAIDVLVTDYSSTAFDAGNCRIPVFLYADDIGKYSKDRGSLLWNLSENTDATVHNNLSIEPKNDMILPFPIAKNNDELCDRIRNFSEKEYNAKVQKMEQIAGVVFNGNASQIVAQKIVDIIEEKMV